MICLPGVLAHGQPVQHLEPLKHSAASGSLHSQQQTPPANQGLSGVPVAYFQHLGLFYN